MNEIQKYEPYILNWQSVTGFINLYYSLCSDYESGEKAYEAAERNFERYFGHRKYNSYAAFRVARSRALKIKNK